MAKTQELFSSETLSDDPYTLACPRTEKELEVVRKEIEDRYSDVGYSTGDTCNDCARRYVCTLVFDPYNSDGDCLYEK